jgi:hypothetical protein
MITICRLISLIHTKLSRSASTEPIRVRDNSKTPDGLISKYHTNRSSSTAGNIKMASIQKMLRRSSRLNAGRFANMGRRQHKTGPLGRDSRYHGSRGRKPRNLHICTNEGSLKLQLCSNRSRARAYLGGAIPGARSLFTPTTRLSTTAWSIPALASSANRLPRPAWLSRSAKC